MEGAGSVPIGAVATTAVADGSASREEHPPVFLRRPQRRAGGTVFLSLFAMYLVSSPFYLWKSGLPQISDFTMVLAIMCLGTGALHFLKDRKQTRAFVWLWFLTVDVVVVSLAWFLIYPNDDFLIFPLYYIFNLLVFACGLGAFAKYGAVFARCLAWGTFAAVLVQTALSPFFVNFSSFRQVLFFNNPNQLGYWSLMTASITFLSYRAGHIARWAALVGALCCLWLVSLSLSKAAMVAFGLLVVMSSIRNVRVIALLTVLSIFPIVAESVVVGNVEKRLQGIGEQSDDSWEGRGYNRIWEFSEYLVLGAAEGGYTRFRLPKSRRHEIHSSAATMLFSYGIVGVGLFGLFLFAVVRCGGARVSAYVIPLMLYGLTHMGLREGLLWLFLAQVCWNSTDQIRNPSDVPQ